MWFQHTRNPAIAVSFLQAIVVLFIPVTGTGPLPHVRHAERKCPEDSDEIGSGFTLSVLITETLKGTTDI